MKKIIALALALVMVMSCTLALAADENMTNKVATTNSPFLVGTATTTDGLFGYKDASQRTDVWLQVEASGQIDVTIPLVAIFKTNIDGGTSDISRQYKMINNSSAAVKVTKVVVTDDNAAVNMNGETGNNMVLKGELEEGAYNQYTLSILPEDRYQNTKFWASGVPKNVGQHFTQEGNTYTLDSAVDGKYEEQQGLWRVDYNDKAPAGMDESYIDLKLSTSKLNFVTAQKKNNDAAIENGVQIFHISYTVMIDDYNAAGGDIEGAMDGSRYNNGEHMAPTTYSYQYDDVKVTEVSKN